jgi:hypothetical protein
VTYIPQAIVAGDNVAVDTLPDGSIEISTTGGGGAPTDATYVVASSNGTLSAERVLTAGTNITLDTSTPGQVSVIAAGGSGLTSPQVLARGNGA